jgi:hypothetical protein
MRLHARRSTAGVAVVCLLLSAMLLPVMTLGQSSPSDSQTQLQVLLGAAGNSEVYAHSVVASAASHGLDVVSAQSHLQQGDLELAAARSDARSGSDNGAGIQSAQESMRDYTAASTDASVALEKAGLTSSVDYEAVAGAISEVNATATAVAAVTAQACAQANLESSNSTSLSLACTQAESQLAAAEVSLGQAASVLAQSGGQAGATVELSQALSFVSSARTDVNASESALATIAAHTYPQRAQAFVSAVLQPLSAKANATIEEEQLVLYRLSQLQANFSTYAQSQGSASANVDSAASALASAISAVDTGASSSAITGSLSIATQVQSNMTALGNLPGISPLIGVEADISASITATAAYESALTSAETDTGAYSGTPLPSFGTYLNKVQGDQADVNSTGYACLLAYQAVLADLVPYIYVQGVQPIYYNLVGLDVSGSVSEVNSAIQQEAGAMAAVQADITATVALVAASGPSILLGDAVVGAAGTITTEGGALLNATAAAALSEAETSIDDTSQAAQSYVSSANAATEVTVGGFAASAGMLSAAMVSLGAQTQTAAGALATAAGYLDSDFHSRTADAAAGGFEASEALHFFANFDVSQGTALMAQAYLDFQSASSAGA